MLTRRFTSSAKRYCPGPIGRQIGATLSWKPSGAEARLSCQGTYVAAKAGSKKPSEFCRRLRRAVTKNMTHRTGPKSPIADAGQNFGGNLSGTPVFPLIDKNNR